MKKKKLFWSGFAVLALAFAAIQFIPSPPLLIPAELPANQREAHRLLNFEGIPNFRDLGGYPTDDGRQVKWGVLYRAGTFAHASRADQSDLVKLKLTRLIDFRSSAEKTEEPNQLPDPVTFEVIEVPTLDDGNQAMVGEIMARIESGDFEGFDPNQKMLAANRQFASEFTPQFRTFIHTVLEAGGAPDCLALQCRQGPHRLCRRHTTEGAGRSPRGSYARLHGQQAACPASTKVPADAVALVSKARKPPTSWR